jgi:cyclopropane fatty-acyl-phospholipid synthase-like methyltransferase
MGKADLDMDNECHVWQRQDLAKLFLDDVRGGIPLAAEQIDVLLRIVRHATAKVDRLLDLGCGDGILGRTVLAEYAGAAGVFVDFSEHMIAAAKKKADLCRATFIVQDLATKTWTQSVRNHAPFDLVLSGLAIHHLPDERKRELYQEVFDLLKPGGLFLNLEHVASHSQWAEQAFNDLFVDSLWSHDQRRGGTKTREDVADQWYHRPDKSENILAPLGLQCQWLGEIGFQDVDCFFKLFGLALFGGRKSG